MIIVKIILFTLLMLIMSYSSGEAFNKLRARRKEERDGAIAANLADGYVISIGIFIILLKIMGLFHMSSTLGLILTIVIEILASAFIIILVNKKSTSMSNASINRGIGRLLGHKTSAVKENDSDNKKFRMHMLIFLAMLVVEIAAVLLYSVKLPQLVGEVKAATIVYDSGILNSSAWIMNLWGSLAALLKIHPLGLIYTVIPIAVISLYYIGYYDLLLTINRGNKSLTIIGMLVIAVLNFWGYQSDALTCYTLLMSYFQTSCFILQALMPFIVKHLILFMRSDIGRSALMPAAKDTRSCQEEADNAWQEEAMSEADSRIYEDDYQEEWDMKKHKIINARNLAIALGLLAVAMLALVFILNNKINTLHDSTVNLQQALNDRCAIYEFSPTPGKAEGYLIQGRDGSLTMIGGGAEENAEALYEFLEEHGTNLTAWYLYGTQIEDAGACAKCVNQMGVKVDDTFILERYKVPTGE